MKNVNLSYREIGSFQRNSLPIYTRYIIDPISRLIVLAILRFNLNFKPYFYTYFGLLLAFVSAYLFLNQKYIYGAFLFQFSIIFDCVDGYVARIKNSGSIFGIMSDGLADFLRVFINLFALKLEFYSNIYTIDFFTIYLSYIFFENSMNLSLKECENYFKSKNLKKTFLDRSLITLKNKLEIKKLRLVFFYYHERYFLIFFIGPISGYQENITFFAIILSFIFLILKILLDIAHLKKY